MYKRLAALLRAMLLPLVNHPDDLAKVGLTPTDILIAIKVLDIVLGDGLKMAFTAYNSDDVASFLENTTNLVEPPNELS